MFRSVLVAAVIAALVAWPVGTGVGAAGAVGGATGAPSVDTATGAPSVDTATGVPSVDLTQPGQPNLSVSVDGEPVASGDTYRTGLDVSLRIEAAVGDGPAAGDALDEVVVRINGEHHESIPTDDERTTRTVDTDLRAGNNTVRVIVTDDAGNVASTQFAVLKDTEAPAIALTAPYRSTPGTVPDGRVDGTNVTVAGEVVSGGPAAQVRLVHEYGDERETHVQRDVEDSFSLPVHLGYSAGDRPTNEFTLAVTDEFGNVNTYEFAVDVLDGGAPTVSLEPLPDETARNRLAVAGVVRDDVWIDRATVSIRGPNGTTLVEKSVRRAGPYERGGDRLRTRFEASAYLTRSGTYEVTVTATDIAGETTTRSVAVERLPPDAGDIAPEIAIDRDRTAVLDRERVFVGGVAFEGVTRRLEIETRDPETGATLDYVVVHDGERRRRVAFETSLAIDGRTRVIVRAIDATGAEHTRAFLVDGDRLEAFVGDGDGGEDGRDGDDGPTVRVEPLVVDESRAASAAVTITNAPAGATVAVPPPDGPAAVTGTANLTVAGLDVDVSPSTPLLSSSGNVTAVVTARETRNARGDSLTAPGDRAVGTVTVQHTIAPGAVVGAHLDLRVRRAALDARGFDPGNLTVYRLSDGEWSNVSTALTVNATHARYRVDSPGLSLFALAPAGALAPPGDVWSVDGDAAWRGENTNWTRADPGGTADGNDSGDQRPAPTADIVVTGTTVNRTSAAVNESVAVNTTLVNRGNATGTYVAGLTHIGEANVTLTDRRSVQVAADGSRTVTFVTDFDAPGNYTVSVNGTSAGPVVVQKGGGGGGLFGFLSFLPLELIGMALGGLVGLGLVLVLARFVLGRVGGDGASG